MAMELRYAGEFLSRAGVVWRCEILQEADVPFGGVGALEFPADEPLVIEWPEKGKEEPLCGSTATLTVISPGDRTYADLYTVKPGTIRLDVLRNGSLYWSGCLDPEFYEEPYDKGSGYDVTLTFSDFGILDRVKCGLEGNPTLQEYLEAALAASGVNCAEVDTGFISTRFPDGTPLTLGSLCVRSDNFTDEDGNRSSWADVLRGILQPLALRLVQRSGVVHVHDLNGLYGGGTPEPAEWDGVGSTMGTNQVYNEVKVTFSPYGSSDLPSGRMEYVDPCGPEWTNVGREHFEVQYNHGVPPDLGSAPECYSFYPDFAGSADPIDIDFTIFISEAADTEVSKDDTSLSRWFHISPVLGGEESEGLAHGFYVGAYPKDAALNEERPSLKGENFVPAYIGDSMWAMRTKRVYLPPLPEAEAGRVWLRLRQEILCDCRYNPFTDAGDGNEKENQQYMSDYANFALVPVSVDLYDAASGGIVLKHWTNRDVTENGHDADYVQNLLGDWEDGASSFGDAWLEWYDPSDNLDSLTSKSGLGGWTCNRQNFGIPVPVDDNPLSLQYDFKMQPSFQRIPDGQFIKYPPCGGWLEIVIWSGVYAYTFNPSLMFLIGADTFRDDVENSILSRAGFYSKIRWLLYKIPELTVVHAGTPPEEVSTDDVEFGGVLNPDARDGLSLDTVCGSLESPSPAARGVYVRVSDGSQLCELCREDVTDRPEQLLIGTLYSQYSQRMTTLSGEVRTGGGFLYTDAAQPEDKVFIALSERQDCISGYSEVKLCELRPDEYEGV